MRAGDGSRNALMTKMQFITAITSDAHMGLGLISDHHIMTDINANDFHCFGF